MPDADLGKHAPDPFTPGKPPAESDATNAEDPEWRVSRSSKPSWWGRLRPETAPSLPLYEVLEEEFHSLHGDGKSARPKYEFDEKQIIDLPDLVRRLCFAAVNASAPIQARPSDEVSQFVVAGLGTPRTRSELQAYMSAPGQDEALANRLRDAIIGRLNELVAHTSHLQREFCFKRLDVSPYVEDLRGRAKLSNDDQRLLNRLLLEAAYPSQLAQLRDRRLEAIFAKIRTRRHAALCFSGGGIRSATFGLGVLQGLARCGLLRRFDYMSTVSGGGYLGGWLTAWMTHAGPAHVHQALAHTPKTPLQPEPSPIQHLRAYSNYLSPQLGLFSIDTWTLATTYIRNLLLNWLVLLPPLAAVLLIPRLWLAIERTSPADWYRLAKPNTVTWVLAIVGLLVGSLAVAYAHGNRPDVHLRDDANARRSTGTQLMFVSACLVPLVLSALLLTTSWQLWSQWLSSPDAGALGEAPIVNAATFAIAGGALHGLGWSIAALIGFVRGYRRSLRWWRRIALGALEFLVILATGSLTGWVAYSIADGLERLPAQMYPPQFYVIVAMPAFLGLILIGGQLFLGLISRMSRDSEREWGARFNAWILMVAVVWLAVSTVVLFGPWMVEEAYRRVLLLGVGSISGVATILLGGSANTPGKQSRAKGDAAPDEGVASLLRKYGLMLAAPIFALSIVIALSAAGAQLIRVACLIWSRGCHGDITALGAPETAERAGPITVLMVAIALVALGLFSGLVIDTNKFSLHAMYRARLIRAFLGASRAAEERAPNRFTGFDEHDNVYMPELWPAAGATVPGVANEPNDDGGRKDGRQVGSLTPPPEAKLRPPLHVTNLTLNLVAGKNRAWQERKAESFTVTPLHAGSLFVGYRRTSPKLPHQALRMYGGPNAISLGTAITISGAAASPNMGYHSSPVVTFLMTLFNARLGWWLGNPGPRGDATYYNEAPRLTIRSIFAELFGLTNDRSPYVYLSDGGHFDNLGLYEMVLRRNRFILVCDASGDPMCSFDDLGNAVRKIRIDLGIPIEFPRELAIYPRTMAEKRESGRYWAIGRIRYSCVDRKAGDAVADDDFDGTLIYIKPAFYGMKEPRDVYNYATANAAFPHESTTDQFYSESQFESYRALGSFIIEQLSQEVQRNDLVPSAAPRAQDLDWLAYRISHFDDVPASTGGAGK